MKRSIIYSLIAASVVSLTLWSCKSKTESAAPAGADSAKTAAAAPAMSAVERGKYLVTIVGCNDCHTPLKMGPNGPAPEMSRMPPAPKPQGPWMISSAATLTAWSGPWGVSYTKNLTPDSATGLGKWDEATFMLAIRSGKHMGNGRAIMPPMPWQDMKEMKDEDLKAIYAYLRTIPAIHNEVPEYEPPTGGPMAAKK